MVASTLKVDVGDITYLDVDPRHGGEETLAAVQATRGPLPATAHAVTGALGAHWYFRHPESRVPSSVTRLGSGLDVRGGGGYVVAPPSLHASRRRYAWEIGGLPTPDALVPVPPWLIALLTAPASPQRGPNPVAGDAPITEGQRNAALTRLAGVMRRSGFSEAAMGGALAVVNQEQCVPPLPEAEVARIAHSVGRYVPVSPRFERRGLRVREVRRA